MRTLSFCRLLRPAARDVWNNATAGSPRKNGVSESSESVDRFAGAKTKQRGVTINLLIQ